MIDLQTYLYEKLVVNKNYRTRSMSDINDITKEICKKCDDAIGEENQVTMEINGLHPIAFYNTMGMTQKI